MAESETGANWDLTQRIIPYLDRHLAFPLLAHLAENQLFPIEQVTAAQYELAKGTNMVDYAISLFEELHPGEPTPEDFARKREKAIETNTRLEQEAQAVLDVIENKDVVASLRQDKAQNLQFLKDSYNVTLDQITTLYHFGQFQFSIGNYSGAADYLYHFRVLSTSASLTTSSHWGKLASDILTGKWSAALEELDALRDVLESKPAGRITGEGEGLHARTWAVHWSLFVYWNHESGRTLLLENFLAPGYLNTIQTACPWILRYLAAAAVLCRRVSSSTTASTPRVKHAIKEVVRIVQAEAYQYSDPVTSFLKELFVEFDFEAAQRELAKAEKIVANDFFLAELKDEFVDNARYLISEVYCRIHQRIDIADLSERLNLSRDEGEKWIVNLIRETRMGADAKIDLEKNIIEIHRPPLPIYQSVIEKTRGLAFRTQAMGATIARPIQQQQNESNTAPVAVAAA